MVKRKKKFSQDFIEKAARLLKGETITKEELSKYKQHRLSKKKYRRLAINVYDKNVQWEIDLAENKDLSRYNNQFRYWLVCIDVYSRYVWVELLKKKSSKNTANKFENILKKSKATPQKIQCDEGTEFQDIKNRLSKKYGFDVFHTYNREIKASHVERVIGTLKTMVRRVLTMTDSFDYYTYFPIIIKRYNDSPHSSLNGFSPNEIYHDSKKKKKIKRFMLRKMLNPITFTKSIVREGTRVRIARKKENVFEKSSLRNWTNETFIIKKVFITDPVTYELEDLHGEKIEGIFYREEIQKK